MNRLRTLGVAAFLLAALALFGAAMLNKIRSTKDITETSEPPPSVSSPEEWMASLQAWQEERGDAPFQDLLKSLPPPETWPDLIRLLEATPPGPAQRLPSVEKFLAATLENSEKKQWQAMVAMGNDTAAAPKWPVGHATGKSSPQRLQESATSLAVLTDDPALLHEALGFLIKMASQQPRSHVYLELPDLVSLMGEAEASEIIRELLTGSEFQIRGVAGTATGALIRQVALQNIDQLKAPQWNLVRTIDPLTIPLYEAMSARFPGYLQRNYERSEAACYYVVALVVENKTAEAIAHFQPLKIPEDTDAGSFDSLTYNLLRIVANEGAHEQVWKFLNDALAADPLLPVWTVYRKLGAEIGKTAEVVKMAERWSADTQTEETSRGVILEQLYRALMASGDTKRARELSPRAIAGLLAINKYPAAMQLAIDSALAAELLNDPAWREEAVQSAIKTLPKVAHPGPSLGQLAKLLLEISRPAEAVEIAKTIYEKQLSKESNSMMFFDPFPSDILVEYANVLLRAGRTADVIALLNDSPLWGAADLGPILTSRANDQTPVGYIAASSLAQQGQMDTARQVIEALILESTSYDPAYELLIRLAPPDRVLAILDQAAERDRFEERPLIWKAELLRKQGDLAAAETTIKEAITVDPSDGEIGRFRRMKAYEVWSAIAQDKGDTKTVAFLANVGKAIRLAEDADRFIAAGLLDAGIARYQEALGYFSDAYCIQSRLAVQLSDQGRWDEAEEYYRKAYELMPDSFGRIESHCFGCEGAFTGKRAQSIAERTFARLIAANPQKPQLHYLLGYLREQQRRYAEALSHYEDATRLDPDYLNAWKRIQQLDKDIHLTRAVRDNAICNLYRLDPSGKHAKANIQQATDLAMLWRTVAKYGDSSDSDSPGLYVLAGTQKRMDAHKSEMDRYLSRTISTRYIPGKLPQTPGEAMAVNAVLGNL